MNLKHHIEAGALIVVLLLLTCCKREEFSWGRKVGNLTYSGNVLILGSEELSVLKEVSDDRLVFSEEIGKLGSITSTSILVLEVSEKTPYGLLRKVNSIQKNLSGVTCNTSDATLAETVKEGTIEFSGKLLEKDFRLISKRDRVLVNGNAKSFDGLAITLDTLEVFSDGTDYATFNGSIGISPEADITIRIQSNRIIGLDINTEINKIDELTVKSSGSINGMTEMVAAEFVHNPVIIDGLVFVPYIRIGCGLSGKVAGTVISGLRQDRMISAGMKYLNSGWVDDPVIQSLNYDYIEPQITDSVDVVASAEPEINILLFGVPVQIIKSAGYMTLQADKTNNPSWKLSAGNSGYSMVKCDILGLDKDHSLSLEIAPIEINSAGKKY